MTKCELLLFFISLSKNCLRVVIQGDNNNFHHQANWDESNHFSISAQPQFSISARRRLPISARHRFSISARRRLPMSGRYRLMLQKYIGPMSAADVGPIYHPTSGRRRADIVVLAGTVLWSDHKWYMYILYSMKVCVFILV